MAKPVAPHDSSSASSPSWAATFCVLLSFAAVSVSEDSTMKALNSGRMPLAAVSAEAIAPMVLATLAILISRLIGARFVKGSTSVWLARLLVFGAALFYAAATSEQIQSAFYMNFVSRVFGLACVFESAFQHWQRPRPGEQRGAILVFLAAIVFVIASRTNDPRYIRYFTPPFAVLLALSMRAARQRRPELGARMPLWVVAIFLATVLGGAGALTISTHNAELTRIMMSILRPAQYSDFSDVNTHPQLGKSFNEPLSSKRVMKMEGNPVERHMRGMAFEFYLSNGAWGPAAESRGQQDATQLLKARPGGERLTITPLIDNMTVLFVPLHMAGVDAGRDRLLWGRDWGGPIYSTAQNGVNAPYQIAIADEAHKGPLSMIMNEQVRRRCMELPDNYEPQVRELALEIAGTLSDPREKMEAVRRNLWKNHSYSLRIDPGAGDPVANFLLKKMDGHCQYFASSTVLLLRCMGVPARYVTGYYAHESPESGVTVVRQRDAHAWAEVWLDDEGWITFDTTPSGGMPGQAGGVSFWSRLWEKLGDLAEAAGAWLREAPFFALGLIVGGALALVFIAKAVRGWRRRAGAPRRKMTYSSPGRAFEALAAEFENYLMRNGAPCPAHIPWVDHLRALKNDTAADSAPEHKKLSIDLNTAEAFAREYTAARFGGMDMEPTLARLHGQLKNLR